MNKEPKTDSLKNQSENFNENFTQEKEQIIIDGANILDCDNYYVEQETDQVKCDLSGEYCRENKNCFYKQLARKTQECEEKEKELKELKHQYKLSCLDCEYKNTKADVDRYRKALDEIEKILKDEICEECPGEEGCKAGCKEHQCLDIINKAKGEGNE